MTLLDYLKNGYSYEKYIEKIEDQLEEQIELDDPKDYVQYYALNLQRMRRVHKTFKYNPVESNRVKNTKTDIKFLVISEGWCGDASQIVPVIDHLASDLNVELKFIFRDENLDLMENYKTNGALSIPILIGVTPNDEEAFRFGPRPAKGMEFLAKYKKDPDKYSKDDFHEDLQRFYNENHGQDIINEILDLIDEYQSKTEN